MTFKVGETYEHTGKAYTIVKRTAKFVTFETENSGIGGRVKVKHDFQGNEEIEVDAGYRTLTAGKYNL